MACREPGVCHLLAIIRTARYQRSVCTVQKQQLAEHNQCLILGQLPRYVLGAPHREFLFGSGTKVLRYNPGRKDSGCLRASLKVECINADIFFYIQPLLFSKPLLLRT